MTAAQRFADWTTVLALDDVPTEVAEAAKLHLLDALGCGLAASAPWAWRRKAGRRWPSSAATTRRRSSACARACRPPTPPSRTRWSATASTSTTRTPTPSRTSASSPAPTSLAGGGGGRLGRSRGARGDRGRERGRDAGRHGRLGPLPQARLPPHGGLRDLRRGGRGRPPRTGSTPGATDERARNRGLARLGDLRLPRGRYADEADPPRVGGARRPRGRPARRARRRGAAERLRRPASASTTPSWAPRSGEIDLESQLADLGSRWETLADRLQAVPGLPLHARLARRGGGGRRAASRPTTSRRSSSPCRRRASSLVLEPEAVQARPAQRVRGEVQPPVLGRRHDRPRPLSASRAIRTTRSRSARPRARRAASATRRRTTPRTRRLSLEASQITMRDGRTLEADLPHQRGGPENPMSAGRGAGEVPRERRARARPGRGRGSSRRRSSRLEEQDDLRALRSRRSRPLRSQREQPPMATTELTHRAAADRRRPSGSSWSATSCRSPPSSSTPTSTRRSSSRR